MLEVLFVLECEFLTTAAGIFFWKRLLIYIGPPQLLYVAPEEGGLCPGLLSLIKPKAEGGLFPPVLQKRLARRMAILSSWRNFAID